jgi:glycosyltransferase involved in cell wall biosynthesis
MDMSLPPAAHAVTIDAVVPNYNYGAYVGDAIESLLNQDPPFGKIIVVNDGSTDNSMEVIKRYRDRVTVLDGPNVGQLGACVKALEYVDADYVYFMDADDMACHDFTQRILPLLRSRPAKVQFMLQAVDVSGVPNGSVFPRFPPGYTTDRIRLDNAALGLYVCAPTSGNVFNVELLRQMPLSDMRPKDFIDFTPNIMIAYMGEIISLDSALTRYRVHGSNHSETWVDLTKDRLARELEWFINSWTETESFLPSIAVRPKETAYVLERQMMIDALEGRRTPLAAALALARCVLSSGLSVKVKAINLVWIAALLPARGKLRYRVVQAKRIPSHRPAILNKLFWPSG